MLPCLAVAVAFLAGCARSASPTRAPADNPRVPVQALLRERALRLEAGDVEGYLRDLSPDARAFEEPIARGALTVPLEKIALTIGDAEISDDGTRFRDAEITFAYRHKELPEDNVFRFALSYDMELKDRSWVVTKSEFDGDEEGTRAPLWATGPVTVARSPHFFALARPGTERVNEALSLAETARERLLSELTLETDAKHLLVFAHGERDFMDMTAAPGATETVAMAHNDYRATAAYPLRSEQRQMMVDLEKLFGGQQVSFGDENRRAAFPVEVFQHELAHLALFRFTRPSTPAWVMEGAAMLLAGERRAEEWNDLARADFEEVTLGDMGSPDDMESRDYAFALAAVLHLVEEFGAATFWDFYQNFKEFSGERAAPEMRSSGAERLLRRYYRFGIEELDDRARSWILKALTAGEPPAAPARG